MFLLVISIILFIIVLVLLIYPNWPKKCGNTNVQQNPCNKCGQPKNHCGCNPKCTFC